MVKVRFLCQTAQCHLSEFTQVIYLEDSLYMHPLAEVLMHLNEGLTDFTKSEKVFVSI